MFYWNTKIISESTRKKIEKINNKAKVVVGASLSRKK